MFTVTERTLRAMTLGIGISLLMGCAGRFTSPVRPPTGGTFNLTGFPVGLQFDRTQIGEDRGEAKSHSILGLVAWGNSSPTRAARNGGLVMIDHLDAEFFNVLGIYATYKTVAFGRTGLTDEQAAAE